MKDIQLFEAVGEVDDRLLLDAEELLRAAPAGRRASVWVKWGSLAACAALAVCAAWFTTHTPAGTADPRASEDLLPSVSQSAAPSQEVAQGEPTSDAPAVEPAEETARPFAKLKPNKLIEEPQTVCSMFPLMTEDFVPMTRQELLDYYGVELPVEELFPQLSAVGSEEGGGFGRGIYRRASGDIYFDGNTFSFTSTDGIQAVNIALDKVSHMPASPWELIGDELCFTDINGWELALFYYVDRDGNGYWYTEFRQDGAGFCVTGKNLSEGEFAALLEALLEQRSDLTPGGVRTLRGTYGGGIGHQFLTTRNPDGSATVEEFWCGPLLLDLDEGGEYATLNIELTPEQAEQLAGTPLGGRVTVRFTGEPATVGTVWPQQLVGIEAEQTPGSEG